jgi:hypothetical protein
MTIPKTNHLVVILHPPNVWMWPAGHHKCSRDASAWTCPNPRRWRQAAWSWSLQIFPTFWDNWNLRGAKVAHVRSTYCITLALLRYSPSILQRSPKAIHLGIHKYWNSKSQDGQHQNGHGRSQTIPHTDFPMVPMCTSGSKQQRSSKGHLKLLRASNGLIQIRTDLCQSWCSDQPHLIRESQLSYRFVVQ